MNYVYQGSCSAHVKGGFRMMINPLEYFVGIKGQAALDRNPGLG